MLVYVVTVAVSAFFVPHYLSIFWEPLNTNPWDVVVGAAVIVVLVALNVLGVSEAGAGAPTSGASVRSLTTTLPTAWIFLSPPSLCAIVG